MALAWAFYGGGYREPAMERLVDAWVANVPNESARLAAQADILSYVAAQVVTIPLYYNVRGSAWSRAVRGPGSVENPFNPILSWNINDWELG